MRRRVTTVLDEPAPCRCRGHLVASVYHWCLYGREAYERVNGPLCVHVARQVIERTVPYPYHTWAPGEEAYVRLAANRTLSAD